MNEPHWYNIYVRYYQTTLFSTIGVALDEGRYFTNVPCTDFLFSGLKYRDHVSFKYFVQGTKEMILHEFFYDSRNEEENYSRERFEDCILLFYSEAEKNNFIPYAISKWKNRDRNLEEVQIPYMELPDSYHPEAFK